MIHALLLLATALAAPPTATLDALDVALGRLEDPEQVGSMVITTRFDHAKPNGQDAHQERVVTEVVVEPDGTRSRRQVERYHDGQPIEPETVEDGEGTSVEVALPVGEDLPRYVFHDTTTEDGVAVAAFEPAPGERRKDLVSGRLAWDPSTGAPLWLEFAPVKTPMFVQSLHTRLALGESEGRLHTRRIQSRGVGGVPGMRRQFEMDLTIDRVSWAE